MAYLIIITGFLHILYRDWWSNTCKQQISYILKKKNFQKVQQIKILRTKYFSYGGITQKLVGRVDQEC